MAASYAEIKLNLDVIENSLSADASYFCRGRYRVNRLLNSSKNISMRTRLVIKVRIVAGTRDVRVDVKESEANFPPRICARSSTIPNDARRTWTLVYRAELRL